MKKSICRVWRRGLPLALTAALALSVTACGTPQSAGSLSESEGTGEYSTTVFAMDIPIDLTAYGDRAKEAVEAAAEEVQRIDQLLSVTNPESQIGKLNARTSDAISDETLDVVRESIRMNQLTGGAFNITIYPIVRAWGFTTDDDYRVPADSEIKELLSHVGMDKFYLAEQGDDTDEAAVIFSDNKTMLDTGAITKGYASDRIYEIFDEYGVASALASLGGNIITKGTKPDGSAWRIGIADPFNPDDYSVAISLEDKFVVTSGGYERYFESDGIRYIHIMDPETGKPVDNDLESVTILSDNGTEADALSTALFVKGRDKAIEFWRMDDNLDFDMVLIDDDGAIYATEGICDSCRTTSGQPIQELKR